ncbi:MAG TPA: glucose-6-phosphate dehydrogenase assembly protein OpcA [Ardenticatenaceae bacterium]|nr:glucose-6-phosphate dehydrogenase assembly protein OpcA [Ardenticatenaceae bacterium]
MSESVPYKPPVTEVEIADIEATLGEMWRAAAEVTGPTVVRTTVANLIIYCSEELTGSNLSEVVSTLTPHHPVRAIALLVDEESTRETMEAWVEMHCQLTSGGKQQLCGEQISIQAEGAAVRRLPAAVLPVLLPDLPVALYWRTALNPERSPFHPLARLANRVILDSALTRDAGEVIRTIAGLLERYGPGRIADLNWARLTTWRELTAELFDADETRPYLRTIHAVELTYCLDEGRRSLAQAYLYLGWLGSRLRWRLESAPVEGEQEVSLRLRSDRGPIAVRLVPSARRAVTRGSLAGVILHAGGEPGARCEIIHAEEGTYGMSRALVGEVEAFQRVVAFTLMDETLALSHELGWMARDSSFEEAVRAAATMLGAPG